MLKYPLNRDLLNSVMIDLDKNVSTLHFPFKSWLQFYERRKHLNHKTLPQFLFFFFFHPEFCQGKHCFSQSIYTHFHSLFTLIFHGLFTLTVYSHSLWTVYLHSFCTVCSHSFCTVCLHSFCTVCLHSFSQTLLWFFPPHAMECFLYPSVWVLFFHARQQKYSTVDK